jgi:dipeptidyl aminopeptidase/acylaminoacyl peptidase
MKKPSLLSIAHFALLALLAPFAAAAAIADTPLAPEQTLDRRSIGELQFSPDGARLVFTVTEPVKAAARQRNLWMLDVATRRIRQLTFADKSDSSPRWSPDGRSIAFLSTRSTNREGAAQLFLLPMSGGEAETLVARPEGVSAFRWSPDGSRIALLMQEPKSAAQQQREKDKDDGRVVDKDTPMARAWVVDVASHAVRQVTTARWRINQLEWLSADTLVAIGTPTPASDQLDEHIVRIDPADGRIVDISRPRGFVGAFAVAPDGSAVVYQGARIDGPDAHDLWLQPVAGGAATNLTAASLDRPIAQPRWIDAQTIAATAQRGFTTALATIARDGKAAIVDSLEVNPSAFDRSRDGTYAYVGETATRAPEVWIKLPSAAAQKITAFNEQWASIPVIAPELVKYKSADGVEIEAALLMPQRQKPLPLVVLVHGGPTGRWSDTFEPWGQLLASRGYAVLYPNVRGSTGYGEKFVEMNRGDWGGGDFKDVMAGVDWAIGRGIADPKRLGIGGWSYGGYMAAWAVTQTTRFKASVSGAPVIDLASEFGTEGGSAYDEWFYGTPYEKLDGFIKSSPITYVKNVKTPTMLLQGEDDTTDPIGQSQQFYRGLKRYHVESDLVLYPREPHGLREEKHLVDRLTRIIAWYDKYMAPSAPWTQQRW